MKPEDIIKLIANINDEGVGKRLDEKVEFLESVQKAAENVRAKEQVPPPRNIFGTSTFEDRKQICRKEAQALTKALLNDNKRILDRSGFKAEDLEEGLFQMIDAYTHDLVHLERVKKAVKELQEASSTSVTPPETLQKKKEALAEATRLADAYIQPEQTNSKTTVMTPKAADSLRIAADHAALLVLSSKELEETLKLFVDATALVTNDAILKKVNNHVAGMKETVKKNPKDSKSQAKLRVAEIMARVIQKAVQVSKADSRSIQNSAHNAAQIYTAKVSNPAMWTVFEAMQTAANQYGAKGKDVAAAASAALEEIKNDLAKNPRNLNLLQIDAAVRAVVISAQNQANKPSENSIHDVINAALATADSEVRQLANDISLVLSQAEYAVIQINEKQLTTVKYNEFQEKINERIDVLRESKAGYPPALMEANFTARYQQLEAYLDALQDQLDEITSLKGRVNTLARIEKENFLRSLNDYEEKIKKEVARIKEVTQELKKSPKRLAELEKFRNANPGKEPLKALAEQLQNFDTHDKELSEMEAELEKLREAQELLSYDDREDKINEAKETIHAQKDLITNEETALSEINRKIDQLQQKFTKTSEEQQKTNQSIQKLQNEIKALGSPVLADKVQELTEKRAELESLMRKLDNLSDEHRDTDNQIKNHEKNKENIQRRIEDAKTTISKSEYAVRFYSDLKGKTGVDINDAKNKNDQQLTELMQLISDAKTIQANNTAERERLQPVIALLCPEKLIGLQDSAQVIRESQSQVFKNTIQPIHDKLQHHIDYMQQETLPFGDREGLDNLDTSLAREGSTLTATGWAQQETEFGFIGKKVYNEEWRSDALPNPADKDKVKVSKETDDSQKNRVAINLGEGVRMLYRKNYPTQQGQGNKLSCGSFSEDVNTIYDHSTNLSSQDQLETAMSIAMTMAQKWLRDPVGFIKITGNNKDNSVPADLIHTALLMIKHSDDAYKNMEIRAAGSPNVNIDVSDKWGEKRKLRHAEEIFIEQRVSKLKGVDSDSFADLKRKLEKDAKGIVTQYKSSQEEAFKEGTGKFATLKGKFNHFRADEKERRQAEQKQTQEGDVLGEKNKFRPQR